MVYEALAHLGWRGAMIKEMDSLTDNGTWDLMHLLAEKKAIVCRWVFTVKVNPDGSIARLKPRLVAKGYAQTYGVDYFDTFSSVAKLTSIRLFISLVATHGWDLYQLDIKNAFLHGDLSEEVYMMQPLRFVAQGEIDRVCRLRKSLYGLKQSPRAWFGKFREVIENLVCRRANPTIQSFIETLKQVSSCLVVYVDDIIITGDDMTCISSLKSFLHGQFHTKDLDILKCFLSVEVMRSKHEIFLF